MHDRQPTPGQEGRMLITPENGAPAFFARVQMADNPLDDGTPLITATLLKQQTASLFGLDADAVPNDAFAWLGKYAQHWWKRTAVEQVIKYQISTQNSGYAHLRANLSEVKYSKTVSIDEDTGEIDLVKPVSPTSTSDLVNGKYIQNVRVRTADEITYIYDTTNIYFIPGYASEGGSDYAFFDGASLFQKVVPVAVEINIGETSYVRSSDRNAYPDSGESDSFEWQYLGVPFDNAVTAPKIVTGSYTGTGTYGTGNKNTLTFDFEPKMVFVTGETLDGSNAEISTAWAIFTQTDIMGYGRLNSSFGYTGTLFMTPNWSKTLEWWSTSASLQGNVSGTKYRYIAIG